MSPTTPLPPPVANYLASLPGNPQGYLFGGPLAVSDAVRDALEAA